jgi:hypothetical protein
MLRRTHGHHRDLQPRLDATISTGSSNHRNQDRYFMSVIAQSQRRKDHNLCRRSSTGRDDARPNMPSAHQIHHRSPQSVPINDYQSKPLRRLNAINHRARSHQTQSNTSAAAFKSP